MKKKLIACILATILIISSGISSFAFENPSIIEKSQGLYKLRLPEGNANYVFDRWTTTGLGIVNPYLGAGYVLMKSSFRSEITSTQIKNSKKAIEDLATGKVRDTALQYFSPKALKKHVSKFTSFIDVSTTYNKLKKDLKNDTTDYKLNIVMNRKLNGFYSKSRMGAITAYNYCRTGVKELMKSGDIKVKMPKKGHSTLRAEITMTQKARKAIETLRKDRNKIMSYYEKKKIK